MLGPVLKIKDRGNHDQGTMTFWEDQQKVDNVNFFLFMTGDSNKCDFGQGTIIDFEDWACCCHCTTAYLNIEYNVHGTFHLIS